MASLKFRHYATESALIGSNTLQVALNAMDVGDIVFIDDTQTQYIITSKNNNVVTYSTYYGKAAITGVTGTGASRTLTFSNGSEITITIDNVEHAITSESCSGNANSATTLQNTRKINGTNFNGSADITTNNWGASRNIGIINSDGSGTAIPVSINGSNNINLKLPSTIKANLEGNASTANTAISAGSATTDSNGNVIASTYLPLSGGTLTKTGTEDVPLVLKTDSGTTYLKFQTSDNRGRYLGVSNENTFYFRYDGKSYTVLHSGNYNSYSPTLTGVGATGTWGINISGNAATAATAATATNAENISSMYPQLAASYESDEINVKRKIDWNYWGDGGYQLEAAIDFNWYETHNLFGVLRGGNTDSAGFGWMYSPDGSTYTPIARLSHRGQLYLASSLTISGVISGVTDITASGNATIAGNVGIGITSPTSKLHVAGNGYFTSDVSSASNIIAGGYIKGETVKISSGCTLQYDSAQKCVKFVF